MVTLYRFFDADGRLLYVGITGRSVRRWVEHAATKSWWPLVTTTHTEHFDDRADALAAEKRAIQAERPIHNIAHTTKPPSVPARRRIEWACDGCGDSIEDSAPNHGWLTCEYGGTTWQAFHARCDTQSDAAYWFNVDRIRTREQLEEWDAHLNQKSWINHTNWIDVYFGAVQRWWTQQPRRVIR